jgi:gag-polyprotein putative aspartyl protease
VDIPDDQRLSDRPMMRGALYVLAVLWPSAALASTNPYEPSTTQFASRLHDAQFGKPGADQALMRWLSAHPRQSSEDRLAAFEQLCGDYGVLTWYRPRLAACTEEARLKTLLGKVEEGDDDIGMAAALADQPAIRARGSARVPLVWNHLGSQSADVTVNGVTSSWFVDTGAEITTITKSLADRMGIRRIADRVRVGTTTSDVFGQVGMIDLLGIGGASVENVPVLILPDDQLKVGNIQQIEGILGLQVLVAFRRAAWVDGGRTLALGEAAPGARAAAPKIYWHEEGLGVPVSTSRGTQGAHLDTGANSTTWRQEGLALVAPSIIAKAADETARVGGAGGVVEIKQRRLPSLSFRLGPVPVTLEKLSVSPPGPLSAARIGMDAVSQFGTFILDFEQMRIDGKLKTAAEKKASRQRAVTEHDVKLKPTEPPKSH